MTHYTDEKQGSLGPVTVLAWRRFGPYHHARADAVRRYLSLRTVELSPLDNVYAWDRVEARDGTHRAVVAGDADALSVGELRARTFALLDELAPAAVIVPGWGERWARILLAWCLERRVPSVLLSESNRHDAARFVVFEKVKSRLVSMFDAALVGGSEARRYLEALGLHRHAIFDGYDVVDNAHFAAPDPRAVERVAAEAPKERFFLASARFVEKKNLPRLLDAYAMYHAQVGTAAWHLVVLGDGALRHSLEEQRSALGLESFVCFPGFKQYDELPAWYARAGCFVHPSTAEQWGLVVNEAMAAGLPVIASNRCGCAPDLVEEGGNGFTVDPFNTDALARAMHRMAHGDVDRARMGGRSRAIIQDWGPDRFANGLHAAVRAALSAKPREITALDRLVVGLLSRR